MVHAFHPSLQCSLENSNVYEMLLRPVSILLHYQESKILYFQATHETNFPDDQEDDLFNDSPENNGVPGNQGDSYSASTKRPLPKKFKKSKEDETMDEALEVLQKSNNQKQEDSFDIFRKHIANEIRSLDKNKSKNKICKY